MTQQIAAPAESVPPPQAASRIVALEERLVRLGERLNPILVKETRQALKSRQFMFTFVIVLTFCWGHSIVTTAYLGDSVFYGSAGPVMAFGYLLILSIPLILIVPFAAFRSLAAERDDRTYELLSITTLRPAQIIGGKLASAGAQMTVYLSAVAPCLAFTYLLRGIDLLSILYMFGLLVVCSIGFCMAALTMASLATKKSHQVGLSVLVSGGLVCFLFVLLTSFWQILSFQAFTVDPETLIAVMAMFSVFASIFVVLFAVACSRLTFAADNRSTVPRIALLGPYLTVTAWFGWLWMYEGGFDEDGAHFYLATVLLYWYTVGIFLTGESSELSPRVRRGLPRSLAARTFFWWFVPGSGTGLIYTLANLLAAVLLTGAGVALAVTFSSVARAEWTNYSQTATFATAAVCYLTIYLGISRSVTLLFTRYGSHVPFLSVAVNLIFLAFGVLIPFTIEMMSPYLRVSDNPLIQISNPFWTLAEIVEGGYRSDYYLGVASILGIAALLVLYVNLKSIARELCHRPVSVPKRVLDDDAFLASVARANTLPQSPWD